MKGGRAISPRTNLIIPGKWAFSIERNDLDYRWKRVARAWGVRGGVFRYGKNFPAADGMGRFRIKIAPEASDAGGCFAMKINQAGFVRRWCFRGRRGRMEEEASRVNKTRPLDP